MKLTFLIWFASFTLLFGAPSPTPFQISDAEIKKIGKPEIVATVKHLIELNKENLATIDRQKGELAAATTAQTNALNASAESLTALTTLQGQITKLAQHDASETARANKLDKALWWYRLHWWGAWIMLGLGVLACAIFAFLKFTGRLAWAAKL